MNAAQPVAATVLQPPAYWLDLRRARGLTMDQLNAALLAVGYRVDQRGKRLVMVRVH